MASEEEDSEVRAASFEAQDEYHEDGLPGMRK